MQSYSLAVRIAGVAGILLCIADAAGAHSATYTPVRSSHPSGAHGYGQAHSGIGHFFSRLFGLQEDPRPGQVEVVLISQPDGRAYTMLSDAGGMRPYQPVAVPSDAERYRTATGLSLPAQHGLLVLPPATPRGDFTYIWANSSTE